MKRKFRDTDERGKITQHKSSRVVARLRSQHGHPVVPADAWREGAGPHVVVAAAVAAAAGARGWVRLCRAGSGGGVGGLGGRGRGRGRRRRDVLPGDEVGVGRLRCRQSGLVGPGERGGVPGCRGGRQDDLVHQRDEVADRDLALDLGGGYAGADDSILKGAIISTLTPEQFQAVKSCVYLRRLLSAQVTAGTVLKAFEGRYASLDPSPVQAKTKFPDRKQRRAAYAQLPVKKETAEILTVTTHKGLLHVNRLAFGVTTFPAIFQRLIDGLLKGIPRVVVDVGHKRYRSQALRVTNATAR
ncbi:hypothetical protein KUF71_009701 [Frankliniella fusca]|uniref:Uncharacterized protein n=1 Tax=Frankliniella fusca TaxID=407009 RepID=A0AAE1HFU6_9NEOP|nr:hypothetical protein KUF71_009701 [Frankliniella fusca]